MSDNLEAEFLDLYAKISPQIKEKLEQARKFLDEAILISEEYGIPFYSSLSDIGQNYVPNSFRAKFPNLDQEKLDELNINDYSSFYLDEWDWSGWRHSQIC